MRKACDNPPKMDRTADEIVMVQRYIGIEEQAQRNPSKAKAVTHGCRLHMTHIGVASHVFACMKDGYMAVNSPKHCIKLFWTRSQRLVSFVVSTLDGALEAITTEPMIAITVRPVPAFKAKFCCLSSLDIALEISLMICLPCVYFVNKLVPPFW